jgi:hypothetical protein
MGVAIPSAICPASIASDAAGVLTISLRKKSR